MRVLLLPCPLRRAGLAAIALAVACASAACESRDRVRASLGTGRIDRDRAAVANLIRDRGSPRLVVVQDDYAIAVYRTSRIENVLAFQRQQEGGWQILPGEPRSLDCLAPQCLTSTGMPEPVAANLLDRADGFARESDSDLQEFRKRWARVNPAVEAFLGAWQNQSWPEGSTFTTVALWPSSAPGRVCAVGIGTNGATVAPGRVAGNTLQVEGWEPLSLQRDEFYGGLVSLESAELALVDPLPLNNWYLDATLRSRLRELDCSRKLPESS